MVMFSNEKDSKISLFKFISINHPNYPLTNDLLIEFLKMLKLKNFFHIQFEYKTMLDVS